MIQFACPSCKVMLKAPSHKRGGLVLCPKCRHRLRIALPQPHKPSLQPAAARPVAPRSSWGLYAALVVAATLPVAIALLPAPDPFDKPGPTPPGAQAQSAPRKTEGQAAAKASNPSPVAPKEPAVPDTEPTPSPTPPPAPAQTDPPKKAPPEPVEAQPPSKNESPPPPAKEDDLPPAIPVKPKPAPPAKQPAGDSEKEPAADLLGAARLRTVQEIREALAEISAAPAQPGDAQTAERQAALRRLKAYRYLAGVPYRNLVLDDAFNRSALAAARLCEKLGRLDHNPPNPGLPEADYRAGLQGTRTSNLCMGGGRLSLAGSVDMYLFDSDPSNIDRLGHRRWCLNPALRRVGFGRSGRFSAMRTFDQSQPSVPEFDFVAYPPPGFVPLPFFSPRQAWSVSLNPAKYAPAANAVEVKVYPASPRGEKSGVPLRLDYFRVDRAYFGIPNCVIFRPERVRLGHGSGYVVEIHGLRRPNGEAALPLRYPVRFVRLDNMSASGR